MNATGKRAPIDSLPRPRAFTAPSFAAAYDYFQSPLSPLRPADGMDEKVNGRAAP